MVVCEMAALLSRPQSDKTNDNKHKNALNFMTWKNMILTIKQALFFIPQIPVVYRVKTLSRDYVQVLRIQ